MTSATTTKTAHGRIPTMYVTFNDTALGGCGGKRFGNIKKNETRAGVFFTVWMPQSRHNFGTQVGHHFFRCPLTESGGIKKYLGEYSPTATTAAVRRNLQHALSSSMTHANATKSTHQHMQIATPPTHTLGELTLIDEGIVLVEHRSVFCVWLSSW